MKKRNNELIITNSVTQVSKGFTVIELVVIMAIIAILTLLAMPNYIGRRKEANVTALQQDIRILSDASESHHVVIARVCPSAT